MIFHFLTATLVAASLGAAEPSVLRSVQSGPWSAASTWGGGRIPSAGDRVLVCEGHRVLYDVDSAAVIRAVHVSGVLRFATDRDTRLDVGLLRVQPGDDVSEEGFESPCIAPIPVPDMPRFRPRPLSRLERPTNQSPPAAVR